MKSVRTCLAGVLPLSLVVLGAAATSGSPVSAQRGPVWVDQAPVSRPAQRSGHAMVFESTSGKVLLFGGESTSFAPMNDIWQYTPFQPTFPVPLNGSWASVSVGVRPAARRSHAMVWDSARDVAVLFGGAGTGGVDAQTWEWNGTAWAQRSPSVVPSARWRHSMAFDSLRGRVVLFGGSDAAGNPLADTWEYDGTNWQQRFPLSFPPPRSQHAMAFDSARGVVVLFGGRTDLADTWEYDGVIWQQRFPSAAPAPRLAPSMAYDPARGVTVMTGGQSAFAWSDTWEWNGSEWRQQVMPMPTMFARSASSMVFDSFRGRMVLFAGEDGGGGKLSDTQEYFHPSGYSPFGTGCPGSMGYAILGTSTTLPALLGAQLSAQIYNVPTNTLIVMVTGFSNAQWTGGSLPASLAGLGMPGCDLLVSPDVLEPLLAVGNTAQYALQLPGDPSFLGLVFHQQGLVFDPAVGNAFGAIVSNAATAAIGN